jgi:hypothetical protein
MAGDWGSSGRRQDPDPWGDDRWGVGVRPGAADQQDAFGQRDAAEQWSQIDQTDQTEQWGRPRPRSLTGPHAAVSRGTGQQPATPREAPALPGEPWDSGPQAAVSPGSRTAAPWRTGPQQPVPGTGPQQSAPWSTGPQQPVSGTGPQAPLSATGSGPVVRPWDAGNLGAPMAWNRDTGEWEALPQPDEPAHPAYSDEPAHPAYSDEPAYPVEADYPAQREIGSGPWPASTGPDKSGAAKPERHSHRASKHGKPSRWRGSANRSGSGGES